MCCYTHDLYLPERYNPQNFKQWTINFERYRTLISFLSPRKIKCVEEILLFNNGSELESLIFDLTDFKLQLYVYDYDDKKLEFHNLHEHNRHSEPQNREVRSGDVSYPAEA